MNKRYLKQIKNLFFIFATFAIISCGKDGTIGPEGQKGAQGVQGVDGSVVHSGSGAPTLTLGETGDYYLDKGTTNLYGPKTDGSWGEPLNLKGTKGDAGENGSDGSKMLSGRGGPASSLGSSGDFYFDTGQLAFYGPKSAVSWGTPVSLKSADANGVKVVIIKDFKSDGVGSSENNVFFSVENLITPTVDYARYYDDGAIFVHVRDPKDSKGVWTEEIGRESPIGSSGLIVEFNIHNEAVEFGKDGIFLETNFWFYYEDWETPVDTKELAEHLKEAQNQFLFDIKIVLIPGTQVNAMKQQNINVTDKKAVAKFLRL